MRRREFEVKMSDGRTLRALETGPNDGDLVVYHAGTPGSRELYPGWVEEGAERGLRHLCYSRPGYHGSDRLPGRTHADCVGDTAAVVDALGVDTFYVVGYSGGGQHALACGTLLAERVRSVAIGATCCPRDADGVDWLADTVQGNIDEFVALEEGDDALKSFLEKAAAEFRAITDAQTFESAFGPYLSPKDIESLTPRYLDFQVASCPLAVKGGIWGWFDDDHAAWGDWAFDPGQIVVPVSIWHGMEDKLVPPAHGRWLGQSIPGARTHLIPEETHMSLSKNYYGAMLDELVALAG